MKPIEIIIVGAGNRSSCYAELAQHKPEKMRIVGVVDPNPIRVERMRAQYDIPQENCYLDFEAFLAREKFADAVINGTMDQLHVSTSVPILEKGYDLLLEKPFCTNEEELWTLRDAAQRTGRIVMICHVLRYASFYRQIKQQLLNGELGEIISIQMSEHVAYHHFGVSYLRGKWANESVCGSPLLLAKSCHDIDLMMWLKGGTKPVSVASFGSDYQFRPENKPAGAGHHCFLDCPKAIEETCHFSARMNYLEPQLRWKQYVYCNLEGGEYTYETCKRSLMEPDNPFSRCVWDCPHDVVDHQTVIVNFADGVTGTFTQVGATAKSERSIHIIGTQGELKGVFEDDAFVIRKADADKTYQETLYDTTVGANENYGGHGGGDLRLCEDFIDILQGGKPSVSCTSLEDSIYSHLTIFRAEKARKSGTVEKVF